MADDVMVFGALPSGQRLGEPGRPNHLGGVGDGLDVSPEGLEVARKTWAEAEPSDFERCGRHRWRELASGLEFRRSHGCPLLAVDSPVKPPIAKFFVLNARFYFLEPAEERAESRKLGTITSRRASPRERAA
ncbi:MAG: hypothetical protein ACRDNP_01820 [Gaiellaceae bacterium]